MVRRKSIAKFCSGTCADDIRKNAIITLMMKTITTAFHWNAADKSISFMAIDNNFQLVIKPEKHNLDEISFAYFARSVAKIIENFYHELELLAAKNPKVKIKIEYKIVHPVSEELSDYYSPSRFSSFVHKQFFHQHALAKATINKLFLSQQLRTRLKRPPLDIFKKSLKTWGVVKPTKYNQYQYHLWVLATHATKSNYEKILKRLHKSLRSNLAA